LLECVINVSEGRDPQLVAAIGDAAGRALLDVHRDPHHNRSVFTLAGPDLRPAVHALAAMAVAGLDVRRHEGVHPRFGVVDVVPFVPLEGATMTDAVAERDAFAAWAGTELALPCFLYGSERTLPEVRRTVFSELTPDNGPPQPHPSAGACAVGARDVLVAYNLWLVDGDLDNAKAIAASLRSPYVRALAFRLGDAVQVSCNLVAPLVVGPAVVYDQVAATSPVRRAELVGLAPMAVVQAAPRSRWAELDLSEDRTIEARILR
jgi:glutamate formiminotransferase